ncbi:MAG TPA: hypothetical protein VF322_15540 [Gammaproteobacteria bacterium]
MPALRSPELDGAARAIENGASIQAAVRAETPVAIATPVGGADWAASRTRPGHAGGVRPGFDLSNDLSAYDLFRLWLCHSYGANG